MLKNNFLIEKQQTLFILFLICILGLGLRLVFGDRVPPSLNWDEVSLGYNAYSLFKTGRDEWGIVLPNIFRAYGDYKLPVYVYMAVASPAVRLPSLAAGVGLIIFAFALGRKLFNPFVGQVTALLVAISPWTLFLSRIALEANVGAFFIVSGLYYLLSRKYFRAILLLGLSVWTYNSARIFIPLFLLFYLTFFKYFRKLSIINYLLLTVFLLPMFWQLVNPVGQARFQWLTLLDEGAVSQINQLQQRPGGRLLYNKATYFIGQFGKNYVSYLSPRFLFFTGGSHYQFSVPGQGLIYWTMLPFFVIGLVYLIKRRSWLIIWLLLAPIAGSITRDSPHVLRAVVMLPLPMLISAVGVDWVSRKRRTPIVVGGLLLVLALQLVSYLGQARFYSENYSWAWQYGYKQAVGYIKSQYNNYDQIIFTKRYGEPHEFVAYYWPWDPADFAKNKVWDYHANWYWVNGLAKIKFVNDWEMPDYVADLSPGKYLVVSSGDNEPAGREVYRVNFLDNKPAFIIKEL